MILAEDFSLSDLGCDYASFAGEYTIDATGDILPRSYRDPAASLSWIVRGHTAMGRAYGSVIPIPA